MFRSLTYSAFNGKLNFKKLRPVQVDFSFKFLK